MSFLSGITDSLFGKSEKPSHQQQGLAQLIAQFPELQAVGEDIIQRGVELADRTDIFTPTQIAQLSGLEQQGLSGLAQGTAGIFKPDFKFGQRASQSFQDASNLLKGVKPALQDAATRTGLGSSAITSQQFGQALKQFQDPFEQQVVQSALRDIQEQGGGFASDLRSAAGEAGAFGGLRQGVLESDLAGDIARASGDVSGQLRSQGFQRASQQAQNQLESLRARQLQGAGLDLSRAGQFGQGASTAANLGGQLFGARQGVQNIQSQQLADRIGLSKAQLGAGQLPRQLEQAGLERETQIGRIPVSQLQFLQGLLQGFPTTGSGVGGLKATEGIFGAGGTPNAGGAGDILAIASMLSDRRLKDNIKNIGVENGHNIYEFSYKGYPQKYKGVMAQDVIKKRPEAITFIGDFMAVNYELLGIKMEAI